MLLEPAAPRGSGADESTGDGAGILIQMPHEFFAAEADRLKFELAARGPLRRRHALPAARRGHPRHVRRGPRAEDRSRRHGRARLARRALRQPHAGRHCPRRGTGDPPDLCRRQRAGGRAAGAALVPARKRAERRASVELGITPDAFYIPSLSCKTIVYKGMFLAPQLVRITTPTWPIRDVTTALAVVHQRYSTNTFPSWRLAQPFRMIAHNGEINTLRGNLNRLRATRSSMACPALGKDLTDLFPDRRAGRERLGLLRQLHGIARPRRALARRTPLMMMIPEAFGPSYHISTDKRAFYEYHAAIMEPWDGPAAMVFTDGRLVGGTLDRNGLRPSRYVVTTEGLVVLASEVGVIEFPPEQIEQKGRLQPGRMFLVDTEEGRIVEDNEIKGKIARQKPYRRWLENRIELRGLFQPAQRSGDRPRQTGPAAAGLRLHARRLADDRRAHGGQRPGAGRLDGHRHAAGRALRPAQAAVQLFQAVVRPGDQPAHRSAARRAGDVADGLHRQGSGTCWTKRPNIAGSSSFRIRSSPTTTCSGCGRVKRNDFKVASLPALFTSAKSDPGSSLAAALERIGRRGRTGDQRRGLAA